MACVPRCMHHPSPPTVLYATVFIYLLFIFRASDKNFARWYKKSFGLIAGKVFYTKKSLI